MSGLPSKEWQAKATEELATELIASDWLIKELESYAHFDEIIELVRAIRRAHTPSDAAVASACSALLDAVESSAYSHIRTERLGIMLVRAAAMRDDADTRR